MSNKPEDIPSEPIEIEHEGKKYQGGYRVVEGTLEVSWMYGSKSTVTHRATEPEGLAMIMLRELVREYRRR